MNNFTFLTQEQIFGDNQLEILKKYGIKCAVTDFAILLGTFASSENYTSEGNTLKDRAGRWWAKSDYDKSYPCTVSQDGTKSYDYCINRRVGARPALSYSSIKSICMNEMINIKGIKEVEYGEYPQTIVDVGRSNELEMAYNKGNLKTTGKSYTTDAVDRQNIDTCFRTELNSKFPF